MSKSGFLTRVLILFLTVFTFSFTANADLLSVIPDIKDESGFSMRISNVAKTVSNLFPETFFAAVNTASADMGADVDLIELGAILQAIKSSNIREFAFRMSYDYPTEPSRSGCVAELADADDFFKKAADTGKFTIFDFLAAIGGQKLVDVAEKFGDKDTLESRTFERGSDGIFVYGKTYIMLEGNSVISFENKEDILSTAERMKNNEGGMSAQVKADDVFIISVADDLTSRDEPLRAELGFSHSDGVLKCTGISNTFKVYPELAEKFSEKGLEVPIVGNGSPFYAAGGHSTLKGTSDIEDILMLADNPESTAAWAGIIGLAQRFGISKDDIGNIISGAIAFVIGVDEKIMNYDVPLGGYIVMTGREGAAAKIVKAVFDATAESALINESKVDGWDKVYTITNEFGVPNVIAQKGESLLVGMIAPESLAQPLNLDEYEVPLNQLTGWLTVNFERIWSAGKAVFDIKAAFESLLGSGAGENAQFNEAVTRLLNSPVPLKSIGIWFDSPEKFNLDIISNPASTPDFWLNLFEVIKMVQ